MNNFTYHSPTEFIFGRDSEKEAGKSIRKYKGSRALVHYGKHSAEKKQLTCQDA